MRDGNRESEITRIKRAVIKKLYSDPDIIEMLNNSDIDPDCPDTAEFTSIFPFIRIPNVQEEEKCYIGVKLSIPEMRYRDYENKNDVVIKAQLTVCGDLPQQYAPCSRPKGQPRRYYWRRYRGKAQFLQGFWLYTQSAFRHRGHYDGRVLQPGAAVHAGDSEQHRWWEEAV